MHEQHIYINTIARLITLCQLADCFKIKKKIKKKISCCSLCAVNAVTLFCYHNINLFAVTLFCYHNINLFAVFNLPLYINQLAFQQQKIPFCFNVTSFY